MLQAWQPPYFVRGATNLREANESAELHGGHARALGSVQGSGALGEVPHSLNGGL